MRGQQEHDEEKIIQKSEPVQGQQEPKNDKSLLSREKAEDDVIWHFEETELSRKIIADLAKGNHSDMDTNLFGVDGIGRRVVEARRQDPGREPTAELIPPDHRPKSRSWEGRDGWT